MNFIQRICKRLIFNKHQRYFFEMYDHGYIYDTGFVHSKESNKVLFADGKEAPWFNYSFLDFIKDRLHSELSIFEYGLGNSTIYYNSMSDNCYGVEHDKDWYTLVLGKIKNADNYKLAVDDEYLDSINSFDQKFDVVIVDGEFRSKAIRKSIAFLTVDGVIILDDSEREEYRGSCTELLNKGFKEIKISGLKALGRHYTSTSLFYRNENCLGI